MELGENTPKPETKFTFVEPGPKFIDLVNDNIPRNNILSSTIKPPEDDYKPTKRTFTEREGLLNLKDYLDYAETQTATLNTPEAQKMSKKIKTFRENLVFVGNREFQRAIHGMAQHVIDLARQGDLVYLYQYGPRSEKYVILHLLEEVDTLLEDSPNLKNSIKTSHDEKKIFEHWGDGIRGLKVLIPDDFWVSGSTLRGVMAGRKTFFSEKGIEAPESFIEALTITSHKERGDSLKKSLKDGSVFAYFGIDEVFTENGGWALTTGASVTGSHASVDYAFEDEIDQIQDFLKQNRLNLPELPLLYKIDRSYEAKKWGEPSEYADLDLQKRWEKMEQKFGIKSSQTI